MSVKTALLTGYMLTIRVEEPDDALRLLERLNEPIDQDPIEAPIPETNAILVMLVEGVHGGPPGFSNRKDTSMNAPAGPTVSARGARPKTALTSQGLCPQGPREQLGYQGRALGWLAACEAGNDENSRAKIRMFVEIAPLGGRSETARASSCTTLASNSWIPSNLNVRMNVAGRRATFASA